MGVDISLHLEIRRQDKWRLMNVTCPLWVKENHGNKIFDTEVYSCRYYHFRDFLNKAPSHCSDNRDILSEEIRAKLKDDDQTGFGVFMFPDLEKHCDQLEKMLLSSLSHAGIYSIRQQLDRIEQKLDGTSNDAPTEKREEVYEDVTPMSQIYEDFMYDNGCLFSLRDTVVALTSFGYTHIPSSDIRIFYLIC